MAKKCEKENARAFFCLFFVFCFLSFFRNRGTRRNMYITSCDRYDGSPAFFSFFFSYPQPFTTNRLDSLSLVSSSSTTTCGPNASLSSTGLSCVCNAGFANCNGRWSDGCEINIFSDQEMPATRAAACVIVV